MELRKEGLGLVRITNKLTEEGFKSATGKELRPQTVRKLLLRALDTDDLREQTPAPAETPPADLKESTKQSVEDVKKETARPKRVAEGLGIRVEH